MLVSVILRCQKPKVCWWITGWKNILTEEESSYATLLSSLLKIKEQQWSIPDLDSNEIEMVVEFICTA